MTLPKSHPRYQPPNPRPSRAKPSTRDPGRFHRTKHLSLEEKLAAGTDQGIDPTGCWLWAGVIAGNFGYGQLCHKSKRLQAHRVAWSLANRRDIPTGMCICHTCDVPACVRPSHLFLGDKGDNARDRNAKGRAAGKKGEDNGRAKITRAIVVEARRAVLAGECRIRDMAISLGLNPDLLRAAVKGATWSVVPDYLPMPDLRYRRAPV